MTPRPASARLASLLTASLPSLAVLLLALAAAAPLFSDSGFLITRGIGDSPNLLFRVHQLLAALRSGEFPARWMPDGAFGYGLPYFTYYASFSTYAAALLKLYGFSFVWALKLTQFGALCLAAAAMYLWARAVGAARARAWLAAAAYTFAPFHLANLYVRGDSLAELWAMALFPLILWAAERFVWRPGPGRALLLASSTALLILTHNISALNFLPFTALYLAASAWGSHAGRGRSPTAALRTGALGLAAVGWGLALAAFFWLPALLELDFVQAGGLTQGFFYYGNHFRGWDLVQSSLWYSPEAGNPFSLGLAQALALGAGLVALAWQSARGRRWSWLESYLMAGLLVSTLMITPLSAWLWDHLPLVRFNQFPWRFLSLQSLFAAAIIGYLAPRSSEADAQRTPAPESYRVALSFPKMMWTRRGAWWLLTALLGVALAWFGLGGLQLEFVPLADADVTAARLNLYEYFTGSLGNTVNDEYLPRWVTSRPFVSEVFLDRPPGLKAIRGQAVGTRLWKRGSSEQWSIEVVGGPATVAVPTHYWPGWRAEVGGRPLAVSPAPGLGWIAFDLEPGAHLVALRLGRTPLRASAELLSATFLIVPLLAAGYHRWAALRPAAPAPAPGFGWRLPPRRLRLLIVCTVGAALGALGLRLVPAPPINRLPLSMDFDQAAYPHRAAVHFEGGSRLQRVAYSTDHLARGAVLSVHTEWEVGEAGTFTLSLVPASNQVAAVPAVLQSATAELQRSADLALPIPADIPPGVYLLSVAVADESGPRRALTPAGRGRGAVHLAPVWVDDPGPELASVPLAEFGASIRLLRASAENPMPGLLRLRAWWQALEGVPQNYQLALRLHDIAGHEWAGADVQAAYGSYPTHLWRPGEVVPDFYSLALPPGTPPGDYALSLSMYDPATLASIGQARLTSRIREATPVGDRRPRFTLTPSLALADVSFPAQVTQGDAPTVTAHWLALAAPPADYRARWTLAGPGGLTYSQVLALAPGSTPTSWPPGSYLLGRSRLVIPNDLAPGTYMLSLALMDEVDQRVGEEAAVGAVEVLGRDRAFSVPPLQTEVGATFGGKLKLWGYDLERSASGVRLKLVWGALVAPGADYKYFVHLFNPADGSVPAQVDAMPHEFTYPTALWVAGEVVTDTALLPLAAVPPGTYRLAVGWYDPSAPDLDRLLAIDAHGQPLADQRVILPVEIEVP